MLVGIDNLLLRSKLGLTMPTTPFAVDHFPQESTSNVLRLYGCIDHHDLKADCAQFGRTRFCFLMNNSNHAIVVFRSRLGVSRRRHVYRVAQYQGRIDEACWGGLMISTFDK